MRCGKYKKSVWLALIVYAVFLGQARGQQPTDTVLDGISTGQVGSISAGQDVGTQPVGQRSNIGLDSFDQARRPSDVQRQSDGLNVQNLQERGLATPNGRDAAAASSRDLGQLPPDPPTEFQNFVQHSTGRNLPLFGYRLFRSAPSTFAPLDRVPVPLDYAIGPGDELLVQVWGQVTLNSSFTVDRAGDISLPQVGMVRVAGLPFARLHGYLKEQMSRVFRNFDLNVNLGQLRSIQIFVVGQARRPGSYTVSSLSTLVDALFVTGGPTPQGSLRHIQLKRAGSVVVDFDLYDLLQHGDKSRDSPLLPGDVIYIPPAGPQVAVVGSVNIPAIYELRTEAGSTVAEALALAAGPTNVASDSHVRIEHVEGRSMRGVTDLALDKKGMSTILRDGDILELNSVTDRFRNAVTLRGNVANPGHYVWSSGMRVGDLFPDRDSLITRDYWLRRGRLGEPVLTYRPFCPSEAASLQSAQSLTANVTPPDIASRDCVQDVDTILSNNAQSVTGGNSRQGNSLQSNSGQVSSHAAGSSNEGTAVASVARMDREFQPRNDVALSAPEIDWSYAVVERQDKESLTTSLLTFNLGRLVLDRDSTQNIELQPNDVITIFSKADFRVPQAQQTRFVRLEGEFVSSGVYSVLPGETLDQLVVRAGGVTPEAYLYGSEFTRESTRLIQQQRLSEYVDQISQQAGINAANTASRNVSALDTASAAALQGQNQNIISSLRQVRASGRIVLNLHPEANSAAQLPPLSLENGDVFVVPHCPSTVSVAGAVYNPDTFLFEPDRRVGYYLGAAGGPNHDADRKRAYLIRADGSVISKQQMSALRGNAFNALRVYPGDTVIVPLNLNKGATLRNIVDISQIFGQFGVALAAASVIF